TYLKKYGLITNSARGVWALTPKGSDLAAVDPRVVVRTVREQSRRERQGRIDSTEAEDRRTGPEIGEEETASWRETLLTTLLEMPPDAFERLCQRLLRESGFIQVEVTGRSGDGGIDGHGVMRLAGLLSFPVIFQCKRYRSTISSGVVRDFRGAMVGRADKGLIITTGSFTRDASAEATRDGAPPIDLIDGEQLVDKLKDLKLGVATRQVEVVEVNAEWFSAI
ncbi:MAG: Mrr restriction system protein, partial [Actinomycetota bacterium]|nr:Mrr restriction system protein [Actinomycetota bacterium]